MYSLTLPLAAWQSLPRQSDELREVVEEIDTYTRHPKTRDAWTLRGIADRLSRIADKGECERCKDLNAELKLVRKAYDAMVSRPAPPAECEKCDRLAKIRALCDTD
jgi:hypothetical protein